MTISSANAMELKYKQPTKLFTNGCMQIIVQPINPRTVQIKPHGHGFIPGDGDTNGQRKKHSCMCCDWAQLCGWLQGTVS